MAKQSEAIQIRASIIYAGVEIARDSAATGRSPAQSVAHIRQGDAQRRSFDYTGAFQVAEEHGWEVFSAEPATTIAFRVTVGRLLERVRPTWVKVLPGGRGRVVASLDEDTLQCLDIAELLGFKEEAVDWWDRLAARGRLWATEDRVAIGRQAERQAMRWETRLLDGAGVLPRWLSIEDNGAGYDIATWRPVTVRAPKDFRGHAVEVKGSSLNGMIHLTRGEWEYATAHSYEWEMQIWLAGAVEPAVLEVAQLLPHVPINQGAGRWQQVRIPTDELVSAEMLERITPVPELITEPGSEPQ